MFHDWLIARNAGSVSTPFRGLLQCGYLGFRFLRYQSSPWWVVTATSLKLPFASEVERIRLQLRCFRAIARIDFVRVYRLLNDLLW
jgi:hypothetical protein